MKSRFPLALAAFVAACTVIGLLFYNQFAHNGGEQQFKLVMQDIQNVQTDLKAALPGSTWTLHPSCSQAHEVYNAGSIGCTIALSSQQPVSNPEALQKLAAAFIQVLSRHSDAFAKTSKQANTDPLSFLQTLQPGSTGDLYTHIRTNMRCSSYIAITHDKPYVFMLMFACSSTAQRFYYPRSDIG